MGVALQRGFAPEDCLVTTTTSSGVPRLAHDMDLRCRSVPAPPPKVDQSTPPKPAAIYSDLWERAPGTNRGLFRVGNQPQRQILNPTSCPDCLDAFFGTSPASEPHRCSAGHGYPAAREDVSAETPPDDPGFALVDVWPLGPPGGTPGLSGQMARRKLTQMASWPVDPGGWGRSPQGRDFVRRTQAPPGRPWRHRLWDDQPSPSPRLFAPAPPTSSGSRRPSPPNPVGVRSRSRTSRPGRSISAGHQTLTVYAERRRLGPWNTPPS